MIVYKTVDYFSQKTGEKLGTKQLFDFYICDFTGEKIDEYENPNMYIVDYCDNDPCFGDGDGEKWLYEWNREHSIDGDDDMDGIDSYEFFSQSNYVFKERERGVDVFSELLKAAVDANLEVYGLDHLLRWSRGRMLEKVIKEGTYRVEQFSLQI